MIEMVGSDSGGEFQSDMQSSEFPPECSACSSTVRLIASLGCGHLYCEECWEDGYAVPCSVCLGFLGER